MISKIIICISLFQMLLVLNLNLNILDKIIIDKNVNNFFKLSKFEFMLFINKTILLMLIIKLNLWIKLLADYAQAKIFISF